MLRLRDKTRKSDKIYLLTRMCIKPTNKLVSSLSRTPLVLGQVMGDSRLTRFTTARTWGSHHLPSYSIFFSTPQEWHLNGFLSWDSQMGVPQLCGTITSGADLRSGRGLNQSYSPRRDLSNDMSHTTCMQGNQVDSRLLMVGSQIANLTFNLSFGHNLCSRCPNGSCEPILDI